MSEKKPLVYGVLSSDRPVMNVTREADDTIRAHLVVEHGLDVELSITTQGMLWLRIEQEDEPGVVVRHFRYELSTDTWDEV